MMGKSHLAFNAASAVIVSSVMHIGGQAFSSTYLLALLQGQPLSTSSLLSSLLEKSIYYLLVLFGALLPDIDHPNSLLGRRFHSVSHILYRIFGHRSITHSLLGIILFVLPALVVERLVISLFRTQGISISVTVLHLLALALFSLVLGCLLHLLADSLTKEGIPLFWPSQTRYGLLPFAALRFRTGTWVEYALLWVLLLCVSIGFATSIFSI